jgi:hypothetical protein
MIDIVSDAICNHRTGEELVIPTVPKPWERIPGTGFVWYDTLMEHIMTETTFATAVTELHTTSMIAHSRMSQKLSFQVDNVWVLDPFRPT